VHRGCSSQSSSSLCKRCSSRDRSGGFCRRSMDFLQSVAGLTSPSAWPPRANRSALRQRVLVDPFPKLLSDRLRLPDHIDGISPIWSRGAGEQKTHPVRIGRSRRAPKRGFSRRPWGERSSLSEDPVCGSRGIPGAFADHGRRALRATLPAGRPEMGPRRHPPL
jgi:hypothetical protein